MRARQLAEGGGKVAKRLLNLKENMARPISAIVVLNNVANIVGSIVVGGIAAEVLDSSYMGLFSAALTFLIIIFSEIFPKTLGTRYAERISLLLSTPLTGLVWVLTPLLWALEMLTKLMGDDDGGYSTNEAQIAFLARQGGEEGSIDADEAVMLQRVFQMDDLTARDIMTPRTQMTFLRQDMTTSAQNAVIRSSQHSRLVVVGETLDDIVGVVLMKELLMHIIDCKEGKLSKDEPHVHKAQFVAPTMKADDLLDKFIESRNHLALVRDEFGQVLGVVTLEDVMEILTGEIVDETDTAVDLRAEARKGA
jgi:CBS domain containing-hemolysin-like protein